ncbi:hypothetical protein BGZ94_009334 [Podila epigama]|nr:hypothetical protein BGZ94_009334 [Podila epigama]
MFAELPNNCYCQITGPAFNELVTEKTKIPPQKLGARKRKRSSEASLNSAQSSGHDPISKKPCLETPKESCSLLSSIVFYRSKILYVKASRSEHATLGNFLLCTHASTVDELLMQIFPRQYGLVNVFQNESARCHASKKPSVAISYAIPIPTKKQHPWRLRRMKCLVTEMLMNYRACKLKFLLQHYCPVKFIDKPKDSSQSEPSIAELLACDSSYDQVTSFTHAIVKHIIPLEMFGSVENRSVVLRAMTKFIRLSKHETISLRYIVEGFAPSSCEWLQDSRRGDPRHGVRNKPPSESQKQFEITCEFLYWMFNGFLIPLIRATFYVTDSAQHKNRLFYYRHELWKRIMVPTVKTLQTQMFSKMSQKEISECYRPYSNVRFLPKTVDLRPIVNLRKKSFKLVNGQPSNGIWSMNQMLSSAFLVLSCERNRRFVSSSAVGMSDLYLRLKQVKERLIGSNEKRSKLYFVKVDIRKSFDSIHQEKLMQVINEILQEDQYVLHKHTKVMPADGHITKRPIHKAMPVDQLPDFMDYAHTIANTSKHAVLVDKSHVQENIVKFGKDYYRQTSGIPQGSILSPSLCRLFYDDMESENLSSLTQQSDSALLRLADDFLFITKSKEKATSFLNVMAAGHQDYGCFINVKKTVVNFDVLLDGQPVQKSQGNYFPYCGYLLNTKSLDARIDFTRYKDEDIRNLLTVERTRHPGRSITFKMRKAMQHMCQTVFSDTSFNTMHTVLLNIYQNFVFCAMKFHAYVQELVQDSVTAHYIEKDALTATVLDIFKVCYGLLHNGRRSAIGSNAGARFNVPERYVKWLGATAFCTTLPPLPLYDTLKNKLKEQVLVPLNMTEKSYFKRKLSSVVHDQRNQIMQDIKYTRYRYSDC